MIYKSSEIQYAVKKDDCKILSDYSDKEYRCFVNEIGIFRISKLIFDNYNLFYVWNGLGSLNPYPFIGTKTLDEENDMFDDMVIEELEVGEIDTIALKSSMKKVAHRHGDLEYKEEDGSGYLIRNGKSLKIDSDDFRNEVKSHVKGKTLGELKSKTLLYDLLTSLGLIKSIKLRRDSEDLLSTLFS